MSIYLLGDEHLFYHIQPLNIDGNFKILRELPRYIQEKRIYRGRLVQHKKTVLLVVSVMDSSSTHVLLEHTTVKRVSFFYFV